MRKLNQWKKETIDLEEVFMAVEEAALAETKGMEGAKADGGISEETADRVMVQEGEASQGEQVHTVR